MIFAFEQRTVFPILTGKGVSDDEGNEMYLLELAVRMISCAERFKGRPISKEPREQVKKGVKVEFSIIFPTEKELKQFIEFLNSKKML